MKWLAPFRNKLTLVGAAVAGTGGAVVATVTAGAAAAAWPALLVNASGVGALAVATNVFSNWASEDIRAALRGRRSTHIDLKRVLAQALLRCVSGDVSRPAPLLATLSQEVFYQRRMADLLAFWQRHLDNALNASDPSALERLFPAATSERELLDIGTAIASERLWLAFYRDALGGFDNAGNLVELCGGVEHLERELPNSLASVFPAQLAAVLGDENSCRPWVAFQKAILQDVRSLLVEQNVATAEQREAIDALLARFDDVCEEQRRQLERLDLRFDRIDECLRAAVEVVVHNTRLLNDVGAMLRAEHDPPLYVPERDRQTPRGVRALRFSERLCATLGRDAELERLDAFLDVDVPLLWWGIVGAAGMGKSHLGLHLVEQRARLGWHAGFLEADTQWLASELHLRNWQPRAPTLIVVDYASARAPQLLTLITRLYERRETLRHPVRVLLLDRPGAIAPAFAENMQLQTATEDHWSRAQRCLYGAGKAAPEIIDPLDALRRATPPPSRLGDDRLMSLCSLERPHWRTLVQFALRHFGSDVELPEDDHELWQQLAQISDDGRPLLLLVAAGALAVAWRDGKPLSLDKLSRDRLIGEIMDRDCSTVWADAAGIPRAEWKREHRIPFERGIAFITLLGGLVWSAPEQRAALAEVMGRTIDLHSPLRHELAAILGWSGREQALRPLEPDLFGEYLIVAGAQSDVGNIARFSERELVSAAFLLQPRRSAETIGRVVRDFPEYGLTWICAGFDSVSRSEVLPVPVDATVQMLLADDIARSVQQLVAAIRHVIDHTAAWPADVDIPLSKLTGHAPRCALGVQLGLTDLVRPVGDYAIDSILAHADAIGCGESPAAAVAYGSCALFAVDRFVSQGDLERMQVWFDKLDAASSRYKELLDEPLLLATARVTFAYARAGRVKETHRFAAAVATLLDEVDASDLISALRGTMAGAIAELLANRDTLGLTDTEAWLNRLSALCAGCIATEDHNAAVSCLSALQSKSVGSVAGLALNRRYAEETEKLLEFCERQPDPQQAAQLASYAATAVASVQLDTEADYRSLLVHLRRLLERSHDPAARVSRMHRLLSLSNALAAFGIAGDFVSIEHWGEHLIRLHEAGVGDDPAMQQLFAKAMRNLVIGFAKSEQLGHATFWMRRLWQLRPVPNMYAGGPHELILDGLAGLLSVLPRHECANEASDWLRQLSSWLGEQGEYTETVAVGAARCLAITLQALKQAGDKSTLRAVATSFFEAAWTDARLLPVAARRTLSECALIVLATCIDPVEHRQAQRWCRTLLTIIPDDDASASVALRGIGKAMFTSAVSNDGKALCTWSALACNIYVRNRDASSLSLVIGEACMYAGIGTRYKNEYAGRVAKQCLLLLDAIDVRVDEISGILATHLLAAVGACFKAFGVKDDGARFEHAKQCAHRLLRKLKPPLDPKAYVLVSEIAAHVVNRATAEAVTWSNLVRPYANDETWLQGKGERSALFRLTRAMVVVAVVTENRSLLRDWETLVDRCLGFDDGTNDDNEYLLHMAGCLCALAEQQDPPSISRIDEAYSLLQRVVTNPPRSTFDRLCFAISAGHILQLSVRLRDLDRTLRAFKLAAIAVVGVGPVRSPSDARKTVDGVLELIDQLATSLDIPGMHEVVKLLETDRFLHGRLQVLRRRTLATNT
jgi:uncharacterized coiled-coil protein SlyX